MQIIDTGYHFFGGVSKGVALRQPAGANLMVLGEEGGGAFIGGLRYGEGTLCTKNAGDLRVFWQGPMIGVMLEPTARAP